MIVDPEFGPLLVRRECLIVGDSQFALRAEDVQELGFGQDEGTGDRGRGVLTPGQRCPRGEINPTVRSRAVNAHDVEVVDRVQ